MNNYEIGLWGSLGGCMHRSYVKSVFTVYCVIKLVVHRAPTLAVEQE